jgi:hypothetical protein
MSAPVSSRSSTVWDSHWDHHMRRIVLSFDNSLNEHEVLFEALTAGSCTQLKAAKELTFESTMLQRVPEHLRSRFLKAVAAASATEGTNFEEAFKLSLARLDFD